MIIKRLAHPLAKRKRKGGKYIVAPRGPHPLEESIALAALLRDYLELVETYKEAKKVIKARKIIVDGRVMRDHKYGVGLFDVVEIPALEKAYRMVPLGRHKLVPVEIPLDEARIKVCKIIGKRAVKGGRIQYNFHDGRNMLGENTYSTKDSIVFKLPEQEVVKHLPLKENMLCFVYRGKNTGKLGRILKIERGWRLNRVLLEDVKDGNQFYAPFDCVIVVGEDKPEITVGV